MASITVVGSLNMDLVIRAPRRAFQGETLIGGTFGMTGGGKGSNQALAAARLGAASFMIGSAGDDDFGLRLKNVLEDSGVDCANITFHDDISTGVAVITLTEDGDSSIILSQGANSRLDFVAVEKCEEIFKSSDAALFQMEIPPETVAAGLRLAKQCGCKTFLSAEPPFSLPSDAWNCIDYMILNEKALNFYISGHRNESPSREKINEMADLIKSRGVHDVVVTQSAEGGIVFAHNKKPFRFEPFAVRVVDTTGARDAFCAGLCVALSEGMKFEDAARFASAAGALACTKIGAHPSLPWRQDVENLLKEVDNEDF